MFKKQAELLWMTRLWHLSEYWLTQSTDVLIINSERFKVNFKIKQCLQIRFSDYGTSVLARVWAADSGCSCCCVVEVGVRSRPLGENVSQYKFSFLCTRRTWERRLSRRADRYAQWGHKCGFSPVCIRLCWINYTNQHKEVKQENIQHSLLFLGIFGNYTGSMAVNERLQDD
jgi:hypothetical protein